MTKRERIIQYAKHQEPVYRQIALDIHARPEVSNYEFYACARLSEQMKAEGFEVKVDVAGHRTGFTACYSSGKPGPVIAFLAEYDALNGIGHARLYGTPGEEGGENGSAKGSFVREGYFRDVDAALCVHPGSDHHELTHAELACAPIRIEFRGKASHAASNPQEGVNALDAMILVFNAVGLLRQQLPQDVRLHGIITKGGDAPNIIPDYTEAKFFVRAATVKRMMEVYHKMERITEGAASQTGCSGLLEPMQRNLVDNIIPTPCFDAVYRRCLESLGETVDDSAQPLGSSDVGNVSQVIPVIQPMIRISDVPVAGHSIEKREASCSETGLQSIVLGAEALALTALELIRNPELLAEIKQEHAKAVAAQQ